MVLHNAAKGIKKGLLAVAGLSIGITFGLILVVIGVMLSLTGIGAIIGIPIILGGIAMPFTAMGVGLSFKLKNCPVCGHKVGITGNKGVKCGTCKQRLIVRNNELIAVEKLLK